MTWNGGSAAVLPVSQTIEKSVATAINTRTNGYKGKNYVWTADVVGWGVRTDGTTVALFWSGDQGASYPVAEELPMGSTFTECKALGISTSGYAVGYCKDASGLSKAVRWENY